MNNVFMDFVCGLDMDRRLRKHAEIIVDHSVSIEEGDLVVIRSPPFAEDLVLALFELIGERGATPFATLKSKRAEAAYLSAVGEPESPEHAVSMMEAADAHIKINGGTNVAEMAGAPSNANVKFREATHRFRKERLSKRWCSTLYPSRGNAQAAGMNTSEYEDFVWNAVNKDWEEQRAFQQQLVDILNPADKIRIVSGDRTDIRMSIDGNYAINDFGENNLPGGEVFTAPRPESVEGEVFFGVPRYRQGRRIEGVHLRFEDGAVVEHSASMNRSILNNIVETDAGSRYIGELGIGMNRDIDRFTNNTLFDEKMGDTIHLALGRAYEKCVGNGNRVNDSAAHVDMITDMKQDSFIEVDGEVIQRNGCFCFEDNFE